MNSKSKINNKNYSNPIGLAILDSIENIPLSASEISNKVDFPRECELVKQDDGSIRITKWDTSSLG